jgi:hypothetical protein
MQLTEPEKLALLTEWAEEIQKADATIDQITEVLGLSVECPINTAILALQSAYTRSVSKLVGDEELWLDWYAEENNFGRKKFKAGMEGKTRPIRNVKDLLWLLASVKG